MQNLFFIVEFRVSLNTTTCALLFALLTEQIRAAVLVLPKLKHYL